MLLYSKLLCWLDKSPQKVATAQQWLGMLNNLQNVRMEEKERSGLIDYLEKYYEPSQRISVKQLMAFMGKKICQCQPIIQSNWKRSFSPCLEVMHMADQLPKRVEAKAKRFVDKAQVCYQHPSIGYWIIRTGYEDLATVAPNWIVLDHKGKMLRSHERHGGWFPSEIEAFDEMHRVIRESLGEFGRDHPSTHFDEYTFLGGKNYQEWFVRLPDWPLPYRDVHFNLSQLLVHIRTTERIDHEGRSLLMVEEIQSPWHADIRSYNQLDDEDKNEYDAVSDAPFCKEWHELAIKAVIWIANQQDHSYIGFTTGAQQCERWWDMKGLINLYDMDIPKCLKKIAAQYDCETDWATIVTRKPLGKVSCTSYGDWIVQDTSGIAITPPVKNKDIALFFLNQQSVPVKEHIRMLHVSDKLKQAINLGEIPLFGW